MKKNKITLLAMALFCAIGVSACSDGDDGKDGAPGEPGVPGTPGVPGAPAGSTVDAVATAADFKLTLEPADIVVVGADDFSIKFTATGKNAKGDDVPFTGLDKVALYVTNQIANPTDTGAPMLWSNNALVNEFGSSMYCTPTGKATARGGAEVDACTLVEDPENPGTYTGTWEHDGNAPVVVADGDPNSMFRVMVRTYNVTDATGASISDKLLSTPLDFIPATGELAVSEKDSVSNAACIKCHSELMGYGEGDQRIANIGAHHNYQKVENCITCHNPAYASDQYDPEKGWNANFNAMIHTIHVAGHVAPYGWVKGEALEEFGDVHFPSELNECTTCHDNGTQWNDNVYAEACVGCHLTVNFETGEGHSEFQLPQADDSQCMNCHIGNLSPQKVHKVGSRSIATDSMEISVSSVAYTENVSPALDEIVVTFDVTVDGAPIADGFDFSEYTNYDRMMLGWVDAKGTYFGNATKYLSLNGTPAVGGKLVVTLQKDGLDFDGKSIAITPRFSVCADAKGMLAKCADADIEYVGVTMAPTYWNLATADGSGATPARQSNPASITADEAKCNSCHGSLTVAKHYGNERFDQCVGCHNNTWGGSYHVPVEYKSDEVDADGKPIFKTLEGLTFHNRDLVTVAHRFHTGLWDDNRGFPAIHLNSDLEVIGYPALATDCQACHKDGAKFFAADGGLTSGKRAIAVDAAGTQFVSPVAESCRSCHYSASALAHFESNGATVEGKPDTTADLPIESCATCHAEGKTYGVDKVHAGGGH